MFRLMFYPESSCYFTGEFTDELAAQGIEDVTGLEFHIQEAAKDGVILEGTQMSVEIESNIALPEEKPKRKSRARKPKATELPPAAAGLIESFKFIIPAQSKGGETGEQFSAIRNGWIAASNGVLTIATPIEEQDLSACPHSFTMLEALTKCGTEMSITQLSSATLSVVSDKFKGLVNCVDFYELAITGPDENIAPCSNAIKDALAVVCGLTTDEHAEAVQAAVLLQANTAVGTNGAALIEAWHGVNLPPNMLVPKKSALAIIKTKKDLTGFGYNQAGSSATFWFADGSWIKTQLYNEQYPNYLNAIDAADCRQYWDLPEEFYTGVRAMQVFLKDNVIYFDQEHVKSRQDADNASSYFVEGLPDMAFSSKLLLLIEDSFKKVSFDEENMKVYFKGGISRGALMAIRPATKPFNQMNDKDFSDMDDEIPF